MFVMIKNIDTEKIPPAHSILVKNFSYFTFHMTVFHVIPACNYVCGIKSILKEAGVCVYVLAKCKSGKCD